MQIYTTYYNLITTQLLPNYYPITTLLPNYNITAQLQHYGIITALQLLLFDRDRLQPITYDTVS